MSAAPRPQTDDGEPADRRRPDADGWALLDGLRRQLDDQAAQTPQDAAQVTQLADSIAALVERPAQAVALAQPQLVRRLPDVHAALRRRVLLPLSEPRARARRARAIARPPSATRRSGARTKRTRSSRRATPPMRRRGRPTQLLEAGKRDDAREEARRAQGRAALEARARRCSPRARSKPRSMQVDAALKAAGAAFKAGRTATSSCRSRAALDARRPAPRGRADALLPRRRVRRSERARQGRCRTSRPR